MRNPGRLLRAAFLAVAVGLGLAGCEAPREEPKPAARPRALSKAEAALIDINTASADELMALKGIGEARAGAIIRGRPYARKDELVQRKIVPQSVYDDIKDRIVARRK